ncbi:hypothetical protein [Prevotella sp. lc2012]|uniref:hypothetical protein n=1 Tax=Prevotella sp. lc2012 TaxID=1761886 RepID=UPI00089977C7|nr:hypothetical protein [Prevotella sp. lc2012]SEE06426.1 hypothetical protein SAMN04487828_0397 [Prevotella sp. lc2012]
MKAINEKLNLLKTKIENNEKITISIFGLGSVGCYLLDYLVSLADPQLRLVVVGRNAEKMTQDVNIIKTAATIRRQLRSEIVIEGGCDFKDVSSIENTLRKIQPDFIVNSSRLFAGLKYGTISWSNLRAYGIWSPMSVLLGKNIMEAYEKAGCNAISINTSYSDAVIPWLKSAGMAYFDFGSGNLNHLIPRMKFYVAEQCGIQNLNDIDITLVASHFHDVVISKEGHTEGVKLLLSIKYQGKELNINHDVVYRACGIPMPTDQKRNMMNASSNFDIILGILTAIRTKTTVKIHTPGVDGNIGGYPYIIDAAGDTVKGYFTPQYDMEEMRQVNRKSIYCDGIENVADGYLIYTDELIRKVKDRFKVDIPKRVHLSEAEKVADLLINRIIMVNGK